MAWQLGTGANRLRLAYRMIQPLRIRKGLRAAFRSGRFFIDGDHDEASLPDVSESPQSCRAIKAVFTFWGDVKSDVKICGTG